MTVAVATVLLNVTTLLNDAGYTHWDEAELLRWGTEGQIELVKIKDDAAVKTVTHQLVAGAKQSAPDGAVEILDVRQNENGATVAAADRESLDRFMPGWMTKPTASYVKNWMPDPHPDVFYVYPAQNATPAKLLITHSFVPDALTANGNLGVRDIYQVQVENYILFRAFSKDAEAANAERAMAYGKAFYG